MNKNKKKPEMIIKKDKATRIKLTEEQKALEKLHHKYRGKQRSPEAKKVRRQLRRLGIRLSELGHGGGRHD